MLMGDCAGGPLAAFAQSGPPAGMASQQPARHEGPQSPSAGAPGHPANEMVVDVRVAGNKSLSLEKILPHIRTRAGRPFDLELIEEDVRRLDHTRWFVNVKTYWQQAPNGRIVIFDVVERPLLQDVKFVGCYEIKKKTLQKEANIKAGDSVDPFVIEDARQKIEDYYHKNGFSRARVTLLEGDKSEDRRAIFLINEGSKQRVFWTSFIGNTIASDDRLRTVVKSKPPFLYLFGGELDRKQIDEDVQRLTAYYRGLGFFMARIGRELEFNEKGNWVTVTYVIDEGPRYKIRNVSVIGNTKYTSDELLADLRLKNAEYFNQSKMLADVTTLQDKYGGIGYVFADVKADPRFLEEPGQLDLIYNIKEGDRYRVGKINVNIKGENPHTQLNTVLNRLSIKPGDIVDIRKIRASEIALKRSQLFENNPATGNPPKIVFSPPGLEEEDDAKTEVADRPNGGSPKGPKFRGQSPDPAPRDRPLDLTCVCPRYAEPQPAHQPQTSSPAAESPEARRAPAPTSNDSQENLLGRAREFSGWLAQSSSRQRSRAEVIPTQYSPDAGQVNPAARSSLQWSGRPASTSGNGTRYPDGAATASGPVPYEQPASTAPSQAVAQNQNNTEAAPTQPAPVEPAPSYGRPAGAPEAPYMPGRIFGDNSPFTDGPPDGDPARMLPIGVNAEETMTGRMMFGVGINSDAGLVGSVVLDEQNFDWTRFPTSWEDFRNGTAFRGRGQRLRIEAVPGTEVQRYMINFQDPYMFDTQVSLGLSGYYYNRIYTEYTEQRLGGRIALGYQFTPDLSGSLAYRGAKVNITDPIDPLLPALAEVTGRDLALHGFQISFAHDKRDNAFMATEGHLIEASIEEVLGSFQYPHAEIDLRKYFKLHERPDGSGRHVLCLAGRAGWTGDNTPIYERYYAGGFSTLRGFQFRGASPTEIGPSTGQQIAVGGNFQLLASAEYLFPITADDMLRGVVFCDTGTVEPTLDNWNNKYRVAPGFGLRISVPAMGPAPIALDFAFPVSWQPGDKQEMFSFFVGFGR